MEAQNWLDSLMIDACDRGWCMDAYCTTCGALRFRKAVAQHCRPDLSSEDRKALIHAARNPSVADSDMVLDALIGIERPHYTNPPVGRRGKIDRPIGWLGAMDLVVDIIHRGYLGATGVTAAEQHVLNKLGNHWTRATYLSRNAVADIQRERSAAREAYEHPKEKAKRNAAKLAERAKEHRIRLARKRIRDAHYWVGQTLEEGNRFLVRE